MDLGATYVAATSRLDRLSRRERHVLHQIALGQSEAGIAAQLCLPHTTVEALCSQVFDKLDLQPSPHLDRRVLAVLTLLQSPTRRPAG